MWNKNIKDIVIITLVLNIIFTYDAFAYVDPGAGSYFFQMLLAFIFAASFTLKTYWQRISDFFSKLFCKTLKDNESND